MDHFFGGPELTGAPKNERMPFSSEKLLNPSCQEPLLDILLCFVP